ncbi:glycosyltransferase family 4 protein [Pengzhenrongella sicca]|uniref:D-inositol 3-phosphate glycosyltransferase n=1 Tax=Pengzhenrongella sicca TaxID=2819238 RepID=A0A8A4ZAV9_9MICO|nr:glycosyltransferase family 4 protein [Pengzhenrongella sicca]QTE29014.1 glycosyltransferase family 4 protein [Pengzhenrongella sicca]
MRIAVVTQYYPPEPVPIPADVARGLAERGHDVRVLTGYPSYPAGRLAPGYRQRLRGRERERDGGVEVRRVPLVISHSLSAVGRLLSYASFAASSLAAGRFVRAADVVYVYATPMTAAIGPGWWSRTRGTPFVLHVQDLWPESVTGSSMLRGRALSRAVAAVLAPWLGWTYRSAAASIAVGPGMARLLVERGAPAERVVTVLNWSAAAWPAEAEPDPAGGRLDEPAGGRTGLHLVYAGNVGDAQDLETVVRAAALVRDLDGFRVSVVGSGVAEGRIHDLVRGLKATNVVLAGRVPRDLMHPIHRSADFELVPLKDLPIFRVTIPSKLQESLALGIPVITTVAGDVADLVTREGLGLASAPGDPVRLAEAFRAAYALPPAERRAMGARASAYSRAAMSRVAALDAIERVVTSAAGPGPWKTGPDSDSRTGRRRGRPRGRLEDR